VSRAGVYQRRSRPVTDRELAEAHRANTVFDIWKLSRHSYGMPRVRNELRLGRGEGCSRTTVARLMSICGAVGIHYRKRGGCTRPGDGELSDDLVDRAFDPDGPDRLWVMDVTEHPTAEGKVYLAVVVDAWSRRVVGWSIADHMRAELVADAVQRRGGANHRRVRPSRTPTTAAPTRPGCSATASGPPDCWGRWAPSGTASTTPSPRRSSPACNASCSTSTTGPHANSSRWRSSIGSSAGTTPAGGTPTPVGSAPPTTKPPTPLRSTSRHDPHQTSPSDPS